MEEICKTVGARIRFLRRQQGYTLTGFAEALSRGKSTVSKYERGEISIDIVTLSEIAQVLGGEPGLTGGHNGTAGCGAAFQARGG